MHMQFCNWAWKINQMARVAQFRGEGVSNVDSGDGEGISTKWRG